MQYRKPIKWSLAEVIMFNISKNIHKWYIAIFNVFYEKKKRTFSYSFLFMYKFTQTQTRTCKRRQTDRQTFSVNVTMVININWWRIVERLGVNNSLSNKQNEEVWFYGISTIVGYLMPNLLNTYILNIYDLV